MQKWIYVIIMLFFMSGVYSQCSCVLCTQKRLEQPVSQAFEPISSGPITGLEGSQVEPTPAILYPNPARDEIQIRSTDPITVIEILNVQGQLELWLDPKQHMMINELPAGIYYARIYFENSSKVEVEKLLVVK